MAIDGEAASGRIVDEAEAVDILEPRDNVLRRNGRRKSLSSSSSMSCPTEKNNLLIRDYHQSHSSSSSYLKHNLKFNLKVIDLQSLL